MPGKIGKYDILRTLGSGASCKVKMALDTETGRKVAIKIINDNLDEKMLELVKVEVEAMSKFQHVNIIEQQEYGNGVYEK